MDFYETYIHSPEWYKKREEAFVSKGKLCQRCGSDNRIEVHHGCYKTLGAENMHHLFILCHSCHIEFHLLFGTRDMMRATKAFINNDEYVPKKKRVKQTKEERRKNRKPRRYKRF